MQASKDLPVSEEASGGGMKQNLSSSCLTDLGGSTFRIYDSSGLDFDGVVQIVTRSELISREYQFDLQLFFKFAFCSLTQSCCSYVTTV